MRNSYNTDAYSRLIEEKGGIQLDIGCGGNKQPGFVGIDVRPLDGVDIVHDLNLFPWPLPDEVCIRAMASHLVEHIPPFGPDPKLTNLIRLMIDKGILEAEEVASALGDWDDSTPTFIKFMNEVWRVMKAGGQFAIAAPHAMSVGFPQDPTHINMVNEASWYYFDPFEKTSNGLLWSIYKPRPWKLEYLSWNPSANLEVLMTKRSMEELESEQQ